MSQLIGLKQAYESALLNLEDRINGTVKPVSTGWPSLDKTYLKGIEPGWIVSIAGSSGTGKTAFINQMIMQMLNANPKSIAVLFFTFEMSAKRLMHRMISNHHSFDLKQLLGVSEEYNISQEDIEYLRKNPPINLDYYIAFEEKPRRIEDMEIVVHDFRRKLVAQGKITIDQPVIVAVDHLLLSEKTKLEASDEKLLENTMAMENRMKKEDPNLIFINLSQLNREMDSIDRVDKAARHFPIKSDIFGSDKVYHYSDVVGILDNPFNRGIKFEYGRDKWETFGVDTVTHEKVPIVYMHNIKVRDWTPGTAVPFYYRGKHFRFSEQLNEGAVIEPQKLEYDFEVPIIREEQEEYDF